MGRVCYAGGGSTTVDSSVGYCVGELREQGPNWKGFGVDVRMICRWFSSAIDALVASYICIYEYDLTPK